MDELHVLVLQVDGPTMTVLTDDGDFLTLPTPDPAPRKGQRIRVAAPRRQPPVRWWGAVAAAAVFLVAVLVVRGVLPTGGLTSVAASVVLDINPSLRLDVDTRARVVQALPLNESARRLRLPPRGTRLGEALEIVVSSAAERGVLPPGGDGVIVYSVLTYQGPVPGLDVTPGLRAALARAGVKARLVALAPGPDEWKEAERLRISVNRLVILERARARGADLNLDAVEGPGLRRALEVSGLLDTDPAPAPPNRSGPGEVPAPAGGADGVEPAPTPPAGEAGGVPPARATSPPAQARPRPVDRQPAPATGAGPAAAGSSILPADPRTGPDGTAEPAPRSAPEPDGRGAPSRPAPPVNGTPRAEDKTAPSPWPGPRRPESLSEPAESEGDASPARGDSTPASGPAAPQENGGPWDAEDRSPPSDDGTPQGQDGTSQGQDGSGDRNSGAPRASGSPARTQGSLSPPADSSPASGTSPAWGPQESHGQGGPR